MILRKRKGARRAVAFALAAVTMAAVFFRPAAARDRMVGDERGRDPEAGRIRITQVAGYDNPYTGHRAGTLLGGASFEVYDQNGELAATLITSAEDGSITSSPLPLGAYTCREVGAPDYYRMDSREFQAVLEEPGSVASFRVFSGIPELSHPLEIVGNKEVLAGDAMRYDFPQVQGQFAAALQNCFWRVELPASLRLRSIHTGTWKGEAPYTVSVKTNQSEEYRVLEENLSTDRAHVLDCSTLELGKEEYITSVAFLFGKRERDFSAVEPPSLVATAQPGLKGGAVITLWSDTGGWSGRQWITSENTWSTAVIAPAQPAGDTKKQ